jgi:hypothetical protein
MTVKLHILQHSLGLDQYGHGNWHRNYFVTGPGSADCPACVALVKQGLMTQTHGNSITGGDDVFRVTDAGKRHVTEHSPKPPKLTRSQKRYEAFLREDSGLRFGEWLRCERTSS